MAKLKIETGAAPKKAEIIAPKKGKPNKYPFDDLKIGQYFEFGVYNTFTAKRMRQAVKGWENYAKTGKEFEVYATKDGLLNKGIVKRIK